MEKNYDFSSRREVNILLPWISEQLQNLGFDNHPFTGGIQGRGWNIRFSGTEFGCKGNIYLFEKDEKLFTRLDRIVRVLIQYMVDQGIVWAIGFSKKRSGSELRDKKPVDWNPWEHLPSSVSSQKRKAVELWCKNKTAKEISDFTKQPGMDYWKPASVHNHISNLRATYRDAKIPTDAERKKRLKLSIGSLK